MVTYFHLGPGLGGPDELEEWQGVVHRGALSTVIDETTRRLAMQVLSSQTLHMTEFQLLFKNAVHSGQFVRIGAMLDIAETTDQKVAVTATLNDESGTPCVSARATFVVSEDQQPEEIGDKS